MSLVTFDKCNVFLLKESIISTLFNTAVRYSDFTMFRVILIYNTNTSFLWFKAFIYPTLYSNIEKNMHFMPVDKSFLRKNADWWPHG